MITFSTDRVPFGQNEAVVYSFGWDGSPPVMSIVAHAGTLELLGRDFRHSYADPARWNLICVREGEVSSLEVLRRTFAPLLLISEGLPDELYEALAAIPPFVRRAFVTGLWEQVCQRCGDET